MYTPNFCLTKRMYNQTIEIDIMLQTLDELLTEWNEAGRPLRQTTEQVDLARETSLHKAGTSKTGTSRKEGTSKTGTSRKEGYISASLTPQLITPNITDEI